MYDCMFHFAEEVYGTESKIIVMDFTGGADIYDGLGEKLAGLEIGILGEHFDLSSSDSSFSVGTVSLWQSNLHQWQPLYNGNLC